MVPIIFSVDSSDRRLPHKGATVVLSEQPANEIVPDEITDDDVVRVDHAADFSTIPSVLLERLRNLIRANPEIEFSLPVEVPYRTRMYLGGDSVAEYEADDVEPEPESEPESDGDGGDA